MRFLVDVNLPPALAERLCAIGHDALHVSNSGGAGWLDEAVIEFAVKERRVILTADLDFGELLVRAAAPISSAVIFRLRNLRAERILPRLGEVVLRAGEDLQAGAVVTVTDGDVRARRLTIRS